MVHGWCCHRAHLRPLALELAGSFRTFCVDLPGHGESPPTASPAFFTLADGLRGFLDEHDLRDVVLVGHSMGGVLSLMAVAYSTRISAVINLDGALPLTPRARLAYGDLFRSIQQHSYRPAMEGFLREAFFLPQERGPVAEGILSDMLATPEEWALSLLSQFPHLNAVAILPALKIPTLFIGSAAPRFDEEVVRSLNSRIEFAHITQCGHFLPVFAPSAVARLVGDFLHSH